MSSKKKLLVEKVTLSKSNFSIKRFDTPTLKEGESNGYKYMAILKDVPVSKYTKNINDRVYSKELWKAVLKSKAAEGSLALADHPPDDSDGSVKDIVAVWHNLKVGEEFVTCDCYLIADDSYARKILSTIEAGGSVGLSSVGYGELEDDDETVNPETYELVRVGDFVINPSQQVYATLDNVVKESTIKNIKENTKQTEVPNAIIKKELNTMSEEIKKMGLLNLKRQIKESIKTAKDAIKKGDSVRMVESLTTIKELEGDVEEIEDLDQEKSDLDAQTKELEEALTKTSERKDLTIRNKQLSLSEMTNKYKNALGVIQKLKKAYSEQSKFSGKHSSLMERDLRLALRDVRLMERDIRIFKTQTRNLKENSQKLLIERGRLLEDVRNLFAAVIKLKKQRGRVSESVVVNRLSKTVKKLTVENIKLRRKLREDGETLDMGHSSTDEYDPNQMEREEATVTPPDVGLAIDPSMDFRMDDPAADIIPEPPAEILVKEKNGKVRRKRVDEGIYKFYKSESKKYPILEKIKMDILTSKTLIEAVRKVDAFRSAGTNLRKQALVESTRRSGFTDFSKKRLR